ncbi:MAG: [acyl-carrier-protein] S-malonyltransferase, partial [Planctomycetaceae bacterium]|nr:[acyl-carrier-protein] S-malonyltransferase [Planctomycetaceae bacterium]
MPKIAFLFPGQGAQSVGMCQELDRELPAVRTLFDRA